MVRMPLPLKQQTLCTPSICLVTERQKKRIERVKEKAPSHD
jgi:hypothetical protein